MSSNIEAEMARFEEEISTDNEKSNEEFKPPPLPPIMPPPMFLPHSLQSGNRNNFKDDKKLEEDSSGDHNTLKKNFAQLSDQPESSSETPAVQGPKPNTANATIRPPNQQTTTSSVHNVRFNSPGPRPFGSSSMNAVPPQPIGPGPMGIGPIRPLGPGAIVPGPIPGPMPSSMLGPNVPPGRPILSGPIRPSIDNMVGPMPPPMPTFFPPPVLPDFLNAGRKQQTTYSSAPVLNKKSNEKKGVKSNVLTKTKKTEKEKLKKKEKEKEVCMFVFNT